jgi:chromosome segregation ATPase
MSTTTISPTQKTEQVAELRRQIAEGERQWRKANRRARDLFAEYTALQAQAGAQYQQIMAMRAELAMLEKSNDDSN